jgi:hypothetical protein
MTNDPKPTKAPEPKAPEPKAPASPDREIRTNDNVTVAEKR